MRQLGKMAGRGGVHSASSPSCVSRSLDRILSDAQDTCELKLSGRKLKDYPKAAAKYNLSDTVLAGKSRSTAATHRNIGKES